jgi:hypothetical protein
MILVINFYSGEERLVRVGWNDDAVINAVGGRVITFYIADDEQLIGCEIDHCKDNCRGLTWLKIKMIN